MNKVCFFICLEQVGIFWFSLKHCCARAFYAILILIFILYVVVGVFSGFGSKEWVAIRITKTFGYVSFMGSSPFSTEEAIWSCWFTSWKHFSTQPCD